MALSSLFFSFPFFHGMLTVLISLSYRNKTVIGWVASMTTIYFSQFWRLKSPRARFQVLFRLEKSCFLVHRFKSSYYILTWWKDVRKEISEWSFFFFIRALIPKVPPTNIITLEFRSEHMNLGRYIHSITLTFGT